MGQEIATLSAQAVHTHSAHTETAETCICIYTHFIYNVNANVFLSEPDIL